MNKYIGLLAIIGLMFLTAPAVLAEELPADYTDVTGLDGTEVFDETPVPQSDTITLSNGTIVLDFEDLTDNGSSYHTMAAHNPYNDVTFSDNIWHWNNTGYIQPHSGSIGLFNAWGRDAEYIEFPSLVDFQGAWVTEPHGSTKQFWYEGYDNGILVATSPVYTLNRSADGGQQWRPSNFSVRVDKVVFRRTSGWWVMDDITYRTVIPVTIDIKPGSDENSINLCSNGATPVAILGSDTFDVYDINTDTLRLADAQVKVVGKKDKSLCSVEDVDADGYDDLVCHFNTTELGDMLDGTSTSATVKGETVDGTPIEGSDNITIVKEDCE
jgi:hypothetical protein